MVCVHERCQPLTPCLACSSVSRCLRSASSSSSAMAGGGEGVGQRGVTGGAAHYTVRMRSSPRPRQSIAESPVRLPAESRWDEGLRGEWALRGGASRTWPSEM